MRELEHKLPMENTRRHTLVQKPKRPDSRYAKPTRVYYANKRKRAAAAAGLD